jgi:hypothetical protein
MRRTKLTIWDKIDDIEMMIADLRREMDVIGDELARMQLEWAERAGYLDALIEHVNRLVEHSANRQTGKHHAKDVDDDDEKISYTIVIYPPDGRPD